MMMFGLLDNIHSQVITVQVLDVNTQQGIPQRNISLLNIGTRATDRNGLLKINIPPGTQTLELQAPPGYEILTPPGPILPVPASEEIIVKFWIKTAIIENMQKRIDQLLIDKETLNKNVEELEAELERLRDLNLQLERSNQGNKDSVGQVRAIIAQKDGLIDSLKQVANEVNGQIEDYKYAMYASITQNYQKFLNGILNMEAALEDVRGAFTYESELKNFNTTIEALNFARDDMHEKHLGYIEAGKKYWSENISAQLSSLYDQAITKTYGDLIIPLNKDLISYLNDAWRGKKSRLRARKKARKNLKTMLPKLRQEIEDMERIAKEVFEQLRAG